MHSIPRSRSILLVALATAALALLAPRPATAANCTTTIAYPGDDAAGAAIADWMARGAGAEGLPGELPVMAGLVESSLHNLPDSGSGYAGFFQMSTTLFGQGPYAGFERRPELQLKWFTTTAVDVRERRLAAGEPDPLRDQRAWGEWIADIERPAERYRGRYQLRLAEARELLATGCGPVTPPDDDELTLWGGTSQQLGRRLRVALVCATTCDATVTGTLRLPAIGRRYELEPDAGSDPIGGAKIKFVLEVPGTARRAARRALRRDEPVRATIDVSAVDPDGVEQSGRRIIQLG